MRCEAPKRLFLLHSDDRIVIAGHPGVCHVGGTAGEYLMVGCRHMGMSPDHETDAAIAEKANALFFAGRLTVKVDYDRVRGGSQRTGFEFAIDHRKGIVKRRHEDAAKRVDHKRALAILG